MLQFVTLSITIHREAYMSISISKKTVMPLITFLVAVFNCVVPLFTLAHVEISVLGTHREAKISGYSVLSGYPELIEEIGGWLVTYTILFLIASAVLAIVLIYNYRRRMLFINKTMPIINIASCALSLIYLINGSKTVSVAEIAGEGYYQVSGSAFIPLIIVAVLTLLFFAAQHFMKE